MDPLQTARELVDALSRGEELESLVRPEALPVAQLMASRPSGAASAVVLDAVMKRNLVFLSYAWRGDDGKDLATGTWILSFGRDGRVTHWTAME